MHSHPQSVKIDPLVKWPGGKRKLAAQIASKIPENYEGTYYEPFLGGGALYFHLQPKSAVLTDINDGLINLYQNAQVAAQELARECDELMETFNSGNSGEQKEFFKEKKEFFNSNAKVGVEMAAIFLLLNKAGFNGIYRENSKGAFNVPFGKRDKVQLYDRTNLERVSELLQTATIKSLDFTFLSLEEHELFPKPGSLIYLDPPYFPLPGTTSSFTSYHKDRFGTKAQLKLHNELAKVIKFLSEREVGVILSNSKTIMTLETYGEGAAMQYQELTARRLLSATIPGRSSVGEYLLWNSVIQKWSATTLPSNGEQASEVAV